MSPLVGAPAGRNETLDVARGVAVLGILWLNIFIFALPFEAMVIPGIWGEWNELNAFTWDAVTVTIAGVMRGMFSILFGASALLLLARATDANDPEGAVDAYFRRLIWLVIIGSVHAYLLIWPHDILYAYGLLGMLIFPFRHARPKTLVVLATLAIVGSTLFTDQNVEEIDKARSRVETVVPEQDRERLRDADPLVDELEGYDESSWRSPIATPGLVLTGSAETGSAELDAPDEAEREAQEQAYEEFVEKMAAEMTERQEGYLSNLLAFAPESFEQQTKEMVSNHLLDIGAFLLIGMALFKLGFFGGWSTSAYIRVAVLGYAIGLTCGMIGRMEAEEGTALATLNELASYTFDIRRLALALANFSLVALLVRSGRLVRLRACLAACGRMALTLYISQTVACNFIFLGYGLSLFGQLEHYQIALLAAGLSAVQLAVAPLVLARWRQGPLEFLLRRLVRIGARDATPAPVGGSSTALLPGAAAR